MLPVGAQFSRNEGWIHPDEQNQLANASVAIAGAGGDGGALAVALARSGIGELRLADPDPFEIENLNRQACATYDTIGMNKARAVGKYVQSINPNLSVQIYEDGVQPDNLGEFICGADLVIDETEFTLHSLGVMIAREARKRNIPNLMTLNVGFGSQTTTYAPSGWSLEQTLGLSTDMSLDEIVAAEVPLTRWLATLPPYAHLDTFIKVAGESNGAEQLDVPTVTNGVLSAAGVAATQAMLSIWNGGNKRPLPVYAKRTIVSDFMSLQTKVVRNPRRAIMLAQARMVAMSKLGRVPHGIKT